MPVAGITGGIATGKTIFANLLLEYLPARNFDADQCVRELLQTSEIAELIRAQFGDVVFAGEKPDRSKLRELVFEDATKRNQLEAILHPRVRAAWSKMAREVTDEEWLLIDIPLLFETGAEEEMDRTVVVACSPSVQRRRLRDARGLQAEIAEKIIAAQMDLDSKMRKADHVVWNDASIELLRAQAELLAQHFLRWMK